MPLANVVHHMIGSPDELAVEAYDGSGVQPPGARCTIGINHPDAIRRFLQHPGELGLARGFVSGDLDIDGDIYALLDKTFDGLRPHVGRAELGELLKAAGPEVVRRIPPPPEEAKVHGRLHTLRRDAEVIAHHYDVSNDFYELVLGPAMTYSCAVFRSPDDSLETAQLQKHDLVCRKLALEPDMRLLDVGCGWGSMLMHAAGEYGVRGVGITISQRQAELAEKRIAEAGLADRVEIRLQDYRDLDDGPFDAISSIGMLEHVGRAHMPEYNRVLFANLAPGGRFLNHGICRGAPGDPRNRSQHIKQALRRIGSAIGTDSASKIRGALMKRYVFPDGELHDVGLLAQLMAEEGFEIRHEESLRELRAHAP